jgi:hypothetical protein
VTQLRVFSDVEGQLHVEMTHPGVADSVRLSAPMLFPEDPRVLKQNIGFLVSVLFGEKRYEVPFASLSSEKLWQAGVRFLGTLDENDSRDILNHLVDILAYD